MPTRRLNDLDSFVRQKVFELLARLAEAGIAVIVGDVLRTPEEQAANVAKGVSWNPNSKHLPQPTEGKSKAIDLIPFALYDLHGPDKIQWDAKDPVWLRMGRIGVDLGFRWGGTWSHSADNILLELNIKRGHFDGGHFEWTD